MPNGRTTCPARIALAVLAAGAVAAVGGITGSARAASRQESGASARKGSAPGTLSPPVRAVGIAADPATGGYWILKSTGGVDSFHAPWHGSLAGRIPRGTAVTAIAAGRAGGYLVLTSNGGVHGFGTPGYGSDAGRLRAPVRAVGITADPATDGYWILRSDGRVDAFHAPRHRSLAGRIPAGSVAAAVAAAPRGGYRVLTSTGGPLPAGLAGRQWDVIPGSRKIVALTFDIGPVNGVPKTLATLRRDHVRATFFITGRRARNSTTAVRAIAAAGELVGDHSNNHPDFTTISDKRIGEEVTVAQAAIESATGLNAWPWFRFPYGAHTDHTIRVVNSAGFAPIGWTVDTLGWKGTSGGVTVQEVIDRVLSHRRPGEIVLMHGGSDSHDGSTLDADALPTVIRRLRADGYSFVTMDYLDGFASRVRAADGAVSSFGSPSYGSDRGRLRPGLTAVGLAADPVTGGYWILKSTGGVDGFHAPWRGSLTGRIPAGATITAIAAGQPGGYLVLTSDGGVHNFGTPWFGSDAGRLTALP